jgi:squalene synthase HpnC
MDPEKRPGAKGGTRTPNAFRRWNLNPVRLPIPPLSRSSNYTPKGRDPIPAPAPQSPDIIQKIQALPFHLPVDHYENFPVASWLLPARLRPPIEAIYGFARGADDIADEGYLPDAERLKGLDRYLRALDAIESGRAPDAPFARIAEAIRDYSLPTALLRDLIDAFKQDVVKKRYADFSELLDYSRRSANPVGRLVLHLFARGDAESLAQSDNICSALQLVNFWQDVAIDWEKGRVYIPQEDLQEFGVPESDIASGAIHSPWRDLMAFECDRARRMLEAGAPLGRSLPGRMGLEIRATVAGGTAILDKIDEAGGDVFRHRPVLKKMDWIAIIARAVFETGAGPRGRKTGVDPR